MTNFMFVDLYVHNNYDVYIVRLCVFIHVCMRIFMPMSIRAGQEYFVLKYICT